ncbi:MAG: PqiC family protein [Gammaproteobacteria bacterium]|nr:PqiC family protein [Gammaproteobacteria bacterium]
MIDLTFSALANRDTARTRLTRCAVVILLAVLPLACSSKPPAKVYLLEPVFDLQAEVPAANIQALGLAVVTLPGYATDQRIASRGERARILLDDDHEWADSPDEAITRVLAHRLQDFADADVLIEPWPRGYDPEARIEVVFDRLLREPTGGAEMAGQIRIIAGDGRRVLGVKRFQFIRYANSQDPSAYFESVAMGINDVARMITAELRGS